jgi:hypothetical protein
MAEHRFKKSKTYKSGQACPSGYHKRKGYTVKATGLYVPPRCVKSTTTYTESQSQFRSRTARAKTARLARRGLTANNTRKCPPGQVRRKAYVRRFTSGIKEKGYTVRREGAKTYRIYPKKNYTVVRSGCIKNRGLPGKGTASGKTIAPLRKGELRKHGYIFRLGSDERHSALKKAVKEFGALGVYRKLNAVAKLSKRTAPDASKVFKADREWVKKTYGPLKA